MNDKYSDIGTHWIALYGNNKTVTNFNSFVVEHIPKERKGFIDNKNIIANILRIQAYIGYINFMFMVKSLTDYTNLSSPNNFKILKRMII